MTASINKKAEKATTLVGYGITDAYTKTEVQNTLKAHTDRKDNPHGVSLELLGVTCSVAELNSIGNINALLDSINGEVV